MRSVFLFIGLLLVACTSYQAPVSGPAPGHVAEAEALESKTVALVGQREDGGVRAYCSGVWVLESAILTANHCIADVENNEPLAYVVRSDVYAPGDLNEREDVRFRGAVLLDRDEEHDLALLYAPSPPPHGKALVTLEPIRAGMFVQSMGQPLGLWWSYSSGEVAAVRYVESHGMKLLAVQSTTPISPGNSGGGLFDAYGQLVGIAHGSFTRGQNLNLFIHYQYADAIIRRQGQL